MAEGEGYVRVVMGVVKTGVTWAILAIVGTVLGWVVQIVLERLGQNGY